MAIEERDYVKHRKFNIEGEVMQVARDGKSALVELKYDCGQWWVNVDDLYCAAKPQTGTKKKDRTLPVRRKGGAK